MNTRRTPSPQIFLARSVALGFRVSPPSWRAFSVYAVVVAVIALMVATTSCMSSKVIKADASR